VSDPITVVVAVYNQDGYTKMCLDAVFKHSPQDTRVIVWDNGSSSPIRQLCSCYPSDRMSYHRSDKNLGVPEAYNQCLRRLIETERVCFLHNDVIVTPEWLERLAAHLGDRKSMAAICPRTNYCDKVAFVYDPAINERTVANKPPNKALRIAEDVIRSVLKSTFGEEGLDGFAERASERAMGAARSAVELGDFCFLTKVETLLAVGGFEERLGPHTYWEASLRDRLEDFGYGIRVADDVFVHHHGNLTSDGPGFDFRKILERNRKVYGELCREGSRGDGSDLYRVETASSPADSPDLIVFTPYYVPHAPGGAEISLHMVLKKCVEFGIPVEAHCFLNENGERFQHRTETTVDGVRVIRHSHCDEIRFADAARNRLAEARPRAALFQGDRVKQAAMTCVSLDIKTKFSWFFRNMDEVLHPNTYGVRMHKVLQKMRGPAFANSAFLAEQIKEEYGRKCVVVLPSISESMQVKTDRRYLACMASTEEKGIRLILRMAERMPHQKFLIAGTAPPEIAAAMSDAPNIEYMGAMKDPRKIYARTRILLVPSLVQDSSPRVILEAQVSGIPVVGIDNGGISEMIGRGGVCVPTPCDERDLVGAVATMDRGNAYKKYSRLSTENFKKFGRHRGPYLFRSAIMSALRDKESQEHEGSVAELIQSLSRADAFRLVRAAITEKMGPNRVDAMGFIGGRLLSSQKGSPISRELTAAAANFGSMIEAVRTIKVRRRLGCLKILVTMKPRSGGGGVLTVLNLVRGLREAGHDAHFVEVGNERTLVCRIDGEEVPKRERCSMHTLLLRDKISSPLMRTILNPDIVVFDDIERIKEPKTLELSHKRFFLLCCGLPGVHSPYYLTDWLLNPRKVRKFEKVFVRNLSHFRYLEALGRTSSAYENRMVSWQGGCDYEVLRKQFGHCEPPGPDSVVNLGTFSKWEWWKGPMTSLHVAAGINRLLPKRDVRWYVPMAWEEHRRGARNAGLTLEYGVQNRRGVIVPQAEVMSRVRRSHVGLEMAFSDAFPRSVNEAMNLGLPMIVSSAIEHVRLNSVYDELCVVQNPNDMLCATEKAIRLIQDRDAWLAASQAAMEIGSEYHANREAEVFIKEAGIPVLT